MRFPYCYQSNIRLDGDKFATALTAQFKFQYKLALYFYLRIFCPDQLQH